MFCDDMNWSARFEYPNGGSESDDAGADDHYGSLGAIWPAMEHLRHGVEQEALRGIIKHWRGLYARKE